jgi:hypothetical protein
MWVAQQIVQLAGNKHLMLDSTYIGEAVLLSSESIFTHLSQQTPVGQGLLINEVSRSNITTHRSWLYSSGRVISSSQRPVPDNVQHLQQTDIHAPGWIRPHNPSLWAAAVLRFRPRDQWARRESVRKPNKFTWVIESWFEIFAKCFLGDQIEELEIGGNLAVLLEKRN